MALDQIETAKQYRFFMCGVVEIYIDHMEFNRQITANVGLRLELDNARPSNRNYAFSGYCNAQAKIGVRSQYQSAILTPEARTVGIKVLAFVGTDP
jgi:hypothetical protein